jgi:hypothetical protein
MRCGTDYVSWWPAGSGRALSALSRTVTGSVGHIHGLSDIYASSPILGRRFDDDIGNAGERRYPDERIDIEGLDERAISAWWRAFSLHDGRLPGPPRPWHTTEQNCSTVVARGLQAGGGDAHASWIHSWNLVWTPRDVARYAASIRDGLLRARRHG